MGRGWLSGWGKRGCSPLSSRRVGHNMNPSAALWVVYARTSCQCSVRLSSCCSGQRFLAVYTRKSASCGHRGPRTSPGYHRVIHTHKAVALGVPPRGLGIRGEGRPCGDDLLRLPLGGGDVGVEGGPGHHQHTIIFIQNVVDVKIRNAARAGAPSTYVRAELTMPTTEAPPHAHRTQAQEDASNDYTSNNGGRGGGMGAA